MGKEVSNYEVKVAQWNVGTDADYINKNKYEILSKEHADKVFDHVKRKRDILFQAIFRESFSSYSIICLQEVGSIGRVRDWLGSDYDVFVDDIGETAVAWKKDRFSDIWLESNSRETIATVAQLKDRSTGKLVKVASAHLSGAYYDENSGSYDKDDIRTGNNQLEYLTSNYLINDKQSEGKSDLTIVGMDANVIPSAKSRHSILTSRKFSRDTSEDARITEVRGKRIDYIYGKTSQCMKITPFEIDDEDLTSPTHSQNPSDHIPLVRSFELLPSRTHRLVQAIKGFIGRIFHILGKVAFWHRKPSEEKKALLDETGQASSVTNIDDSPNLSDEEVLDSLISYLGDEKNITKEGIFRVNGSNTTIDAQYPLLLKGKADFTKLDVNDVAGLMKKWIKEQKFYSSVSVDVRWATNRKLHLRERIILFLGKISHNSDKNNMTPENLAICIGPNFYPDTAESQLEYIQSRKKEDLIEEIQLAAFFARRSKLYNEI